MIFVWRLNWNTADIPLNNVKTYANDVDGVDGPNGKFWSLLATNLIKIV